MQTYTNCTYCTHIILSNDLRDDPKCHMHADAYVLRMKSFTAGEASTI